MSGLHDHPSPDIPQWQPEPLYLPVDHGPAEEGPRRGNRNRTGDHDRDHDLPGSHVIVIDLD